jgi:hypothetical protein
VRHGIWLAYCARARLLPLDAIARRLAPDPEITIRLESDVLIAAVDDSLTGHSTEITVGIDTGAHVRLEAAEVAARLASGRLTADEGVPTPDREALAGADCRYELRWDLRFSDETYNAMLVIAGVVMQECGAIVYDVTNQRFV